MDENGLAALSQKEIMSLPVQKVSKKFEIFPAPSFKTQKKYLAPHKRISVGRGEYKPWRIRIQILTTRNLLG